MALNNPTDDSTLCVEDVWSIKQQAASLIGTVVKYQTGLFGVATKVKKVPSKADYFLAVQTHEDRVDPNLKNFREYHRRDYHPERTAYSALNTLVPSLEPVFYRSEPLVKDGLTLNVGAPIFSEEGLVAAEVSCTTEAGIVIESFEKTMSITMLLDDWMPGVTEEAMEEDTETRLDIGHLSALKWLIRFVACDWDIFEADITGYQSFKILSSHLAELIGVLLPAANDVLFSDAVVLEQAARVDAILRRSRKSAVARSFARAVKIV